MPRVGVEPTIPVFERAKAVHALDGATTVIGCRLHVRRVFIEKPTLALTLKKF
jgi:hypothetical protein